MAKPFAALQPGARQGVMSKNPSSILDMYQVDKLMRHPGTMLSGRQGWIPSGWANTQVPFPL